jgi:hypothetical protein
MSQISEVQALGAVTQIVDDEMSLSPRAFSARTRFDPMIRRRR